MKNLFQSPAMVRGIRTLVDGGNKLDIETQELSPEKMTILFSIGEAAVLFSIKGKGSYFLFKESEIKEDDLKDIPEVKPEFPKDKTPGQRLRGVIYCIWERGDKKEGFESYYRTKMSMITDGLKEKYLKD